MISFKQFITEISKEMLARYIAGRVNQKPLDLRKTRSGKEARREQMRRGSTQAAWGKLYQKVGDTKKADSMVRSARKGLSESQRFRLYPTDHLAPTPRGKAIASGFGPAPPLSVSAQQAIAASKKRRVERNDVKRQAHQEFIQANADRLAGSVATPKKDLFQAAKEHVNSLSDNDIHSIVKKVDNKETTLGDYMRSHDFRGSHKTLLKDRINQHPDYTNWSPPRLHNDSGLRTPQQPSKASGQMVKPSHVPSAPVVHNAVPNTKKATNTPQVARAEMNAISDDEVHSIVNRINNNETSLPKVVADKGHKLFAAPMLLTRIRRHPDYANWSPPKAKVVKEERLRSPAEILKRAARRYGPSIKGNLTDPEYGKLDKSKLIPLKKYNQKFADSAFEKYDELPPDFPRHSDVSVPIDELHPGQEYVHVSDDRKLHQKVASKNDRIIVVKHKGKHMLIDGHHATMAAWARGEDHITPTEYIDMDGYNPKKH